ncbi:hypothetical protein KFL_000950240 [Klebsormidium nitens]|uniref:Uncharacterized protein n=1 Tax=Klebsormidium nitens TaxID=105231 RepID=A0A1Y1I1F0_KLENI|nr:hypothetical protein KFL_000950240 [Klebsormidium nitens]|eukprot:GAQ81948.1 hypothetical protein KFL_000950240 [Klebsormidium nitens]
MGMRAGAISLSLVGTAGLVMFFVGFLSCDSIYSRDSVLLPTWLGRIGATSQAPNRFALGRALGSPTSNVVEQDACLVPCDILQLANLTSLDQVQKVNCNLEFSSVADLGSFLAERKGQAWLHVMGDSLLRYQFASMVEDLSSDTAPDFVSGICCRSSDPRNGTGLERGACKTWTLVDQDWDPRRTRELVKENLEEGGFDFCMTYFGVQFILQVLSYNEYFFQQDSIQPLAVIYNMGLHHIMYGQGQLFYEKDLEKLTIQVTQILEQQNASLAVSGTKGLHLTKFIYHTMTAYDEEIFQYVDPNRRNERTDLFVKVQERHFAVNKVWKVVDAYRLTKYLDRRHTWLQVTPGDGIHPAKPFYQIMALLDLNYIVRDLESFCTKVDDLEYKEFLIDHEDTELAENMRQRHGWGLYSNFARRRR